MASLASCASKPTKFAFIPPPQELLRECKAGDVPVLTNGDLIKLIHAGRTALKLCNADKAGLREWVKDMEKR